MTLNALSFYCDCSSYTGDNTFAVVGGIAVKTRLVSMLENQIQALKNSVGMSGEFKWSAYRGGARKTAYEGLVDLFFEAIELDYLHFHMMIADFYKFDHHMKGRGTHSRSVSKLYYQLMLHEVCCRYGDKWRITMFPDHGNDSDEIGQYRVGICANAYKKYDAQPNSLRDIHPTPSKKVVLLQMVDVAIGAAAAERENRTLRACKSELRQYFMAKCPVTDLSIDTPKQERTFSVWNFNC